MNRVGEEWYVLPVWTGRLGVVVVVTAFEGKLVHSSAATAGTGVAADS